MRVTDKMIFERASLNTGHARERIQKALDETSTGLRVTRPWDDPVAAGRVVQHRLSADRFNATYEGTKRASEELLAADGSLSAVQNAITRARELTVQHSNDVYSAADRVGAAEEIEGLARDIIRAMNLQVGNRYIFGGHLDDAPPFQADGAYVGDANVRQLEIAPGIMQDTSVRADVAIKGVGGGVDVLTVLADLVTALRANDGNGIRAALDPLDQGTRQVSTAQSQVGSALNIMDAAANTNRLALHGEQDTIAKLTEADLVESSSRLVMAQRALEAALAASARSFDGTLLNRLR